MGNRSRPGTQIEEPAAHAERVHRVIDGSPADPTNDEVSTSWRRSASEFHVDPESAKAPRILTSHEVGEVREPLDELIHSAQYELDKLYTMVSDAGYTVLFCDPDGVAVDHRGDESDASRFRYWGTWLGGVWAEAIEGTNGIGTCILEQRPVTVHRGQHYRSRHIDLSCSGAPIFGIDGRLIAVLDVSAIHPERSEQAHALTGILTVTTAHSIEERFFRERYRSEWVVATAPPAQAADGMLLAIDSGQRIVGANRRGRAAFSLDDQKLGAGISLWSLFERNTAPFGRNIVADLPARLVSIDTGEGWPSLVTPPDKMPSPGSGASSMALHRRPRLDLLGDLGSLIPATPQRGGLSPRTMRRLDNYIEAHLSEAIGLAALAAVAGLSLYHFARQFKETTGVTPHQYLVRKRVEQAQRIMSNSSTSLSTIAFLTGFSDQSHLTRHFSRLNGMTPGQFRRLQR